MFLINPSGEIAVEYGSYLSGQIPGVAGPGPARCMALAFLLFYLDFSLDCNCRYFINLLTTLTTNVRTDNTCNLLNDLAKDVVKNTFIKSVARKLSKSALIQV